jgi:glutamate/tyrosine decarboxylase-like PLP-dependent enzyme
MTIGAVDTHGDRYGNAFLLGDAPDHRLPETGMPAVDAMRLLAEELVLDGIPWRNLATFVTTWMEPEAQRVIAENLHSNYIDHAEYPHTAEIEPHVDENTIGVAAVLGTTFTGHADDIVGINDLLVRLNDEKSLDVPLHIDGASGGFVWPFVYPDSPCDFRLERA